MAYTLLDSGHHRKLEKVGDYLLVRPCSQAVWNPTLDESEWHKADALFSREPANRWKGKIPASWQLSYENLLFKIVPTDFGHLGVFPEHALLWRWMKERLKKGCSVLNLFAYTGGATLTAAAAGAQVCHVDASKTAVAWARENAALSQLDKAPIRWIVDDVVKFLQREVRRKSRYDAIILDPPTFGRGNKGEVFKIENDLPKILELCFSLLSDAPLFLILSSHTPGYTPLVLHHLLVQASHKGGVEQGEMVIPGPFDLPSGSFARWYV